MNNIEYRKKFITKYLKQDYILPENILMLGSENFPEENILLYGFFDLDENLSFVDGWVLVYQSGFLVVQNGISMGRIEYRDLNKILEIQSLSCTTYIFSRSNGKVPFGKIHFTFRQKISMNQVKYLIELKKNGKEKTVIDNDPNKTYAEAVMKSIVDAQNSVAGDGKKTLGRLLSYLLPYRKELIAGMTGAVFVTVLNLIPAFLSGKIIDDVVRPFNDGVINRNEGISIGLLMIGSLALSYLLRELFMWVRLKKMSVLGENVAKDLRRELYKHLQSLELDFYSKKQTGSIISRVSSDTDRIWDFIAFGVVELSISILMLIGLSTMLIFLDWKLGLLMTIPVPIFLVSIYRHGEKMKKMFLKAWRKWSGLTNVLSDTIPGIQVVKAFNQEEREKKRFNRSNERATKEFNNIHVVWTSFWPKLMGGIHFIMLAVWYFALPRLLSTDEDSITSGTFVSFLLYMTMFSAPIEVIGQVARMMNRALSSAHRIFEVLDARSSIIQEKDPIRLESLRGDIKFKNVFFSYDGVRQVIKDMSFHVKQGEMIGLVGKSGGGKSTITKLISRFYDISSGEILIDGHDLRKLDCGEFRKQVGIVLQEPYLFHGTIWENISYGAPEADMGRIIEAAKVANAHDFIMSLPYGYDTVIGERGHDLSGGERQRVSIARAVLADPKVLILDEATSAVDTETERNIQEALDRLSKGRTVFAVAHRLSTLRKANRIFVIGDGKIVEEGTHSDLLSKINGEYAKLHQMQKEMSESFLL